MHLERLDLARLRDTLGTVTTIVASDVENPLLGPHGAAAVFGPQRAPPRTGGGARAGTAALVSAGLRSDRTRGRRTPGAGAAGGTGFAALALLDAAIKPGIELILI